MDTPTDLQTSSKPVPATTPPSAQPRSDVALPLAEPSPEIVGAAPPRVLSDNRIISGIDLIDFSVGGLMPNKLYAVKGGIGVGKTIFGLQFLTRGLELGETGILITDQRPENVVAQARAIGFPIEAAVKRQQLVILNPSKRYFDLVESPADVMAIVEELGDYAKKVGANRLVIDPIYTLVNTSYSSHFALTLTQSLLNALEDLPLTTLLIAGDEDNAELNAIVRMLEQNSFGVIALSQDPSTGGRLMRLSKLRYANSEHLAAHYRILDGRGLINYRGEGERVADVTKPWDEPAEINRKVLVIGAPAETARRVKESLGDPYEVQVESDLAAGVERARRETPGLVVVTPQRSVNAVAAILDLARNSTSAIAFVSPASNRQSDRVLYLRAGADDFIPEPFTPAEFRARADALIRRSGRRLNVRDTGIGTVTPQDLTALLQSREAESRPKGDVIRANDGGLALDPEFGDRLSRNVDTVAKLDMPFALYWIKASDKDKELSRELAKLCRQEDIVCHNRSGEFVAILTGTDESGVRGFENRLQEKLGRKINSPAVRRGYSLHMPGEPVTELVQRAFA